MNPPGNGVGEIKKKMKPLLPPPLVSGVGVMDVGQGSCILAYRPNGDPFFYYDIGYPLWFYTRSAPAGLNPNVGPYLGPCLFNDPMIILSHWDWDHWRLARIAHDRAVQHGVDVVDLRWCFPVQPIGPAATNFRNALTQAFPWPPALPNLNFAGIGMILRCTGDDINNSGLAVAIQTLLPSADPVNHFMIFTGDASFGNVPLPAPVLASTGIAAVHHGSDSHGAAENLPHPPVPYNLTGRIAFSYGIYQRADGTIGRPYGHPRIAATAAQSAAGWRNIASTAESAFNADDPANRGNIRMGQFIAPQCQPNSCAFEDFPLNKRLD
jgi:hypothetical protein